MEKEKLRFTEIDLLRFLAAFCVMFFHYTIRGHAEADALTPVHFPVLSEVTKYGYMGVDLFFMISGFVILMTAIDRSAREFVISRMVRLYPAFWACCTLTFVITSIWGPEILQVPFKRYLINMTMLHGFFPIGHVDGVYWTLFVEMKFYIFTFLLILFKQMHRISFYLGLWLIISIIALQFYSETLNNLLITEYSAYFIAGCVFYLIYREGFSFYKGALLAGSYVVALCNAAVHMYTKSNWYQIPFDLSIVAAIIGLLYAIFLAIAGNKTENLRRNFYVYLGALTYPLYLLHARIGFTLFNNINDQINKRLLLVLVMATVVGLAYLVHAQVERKFGPPFKRFLEKRLKPRPKLIPATS